MPMDGMWEWGLGIELMLADWRDDKDADNDFSRQLFLVMWTIGGNGQGFWMTMIRNVYIGSFSGCTAKGRN